MVHVTLLFVRRWVEMRCGFPQVETQVARGGHQQGPISLCPAASVFICDVPVVALAVPSRLPSGCGILLSHICNSVSAEMREETGDT